MTRPTVDFRIGLLLAGLLLALLRVPAQAQSNPEESIQIFFSAGCADCWPYVEQDLMPALSAGGVLAEAEIH
ncbi:MAG: hypothetical protein AABY97_08885, partial [Chloroflexota bacterium]